MRPPNVSGGLFQQLSKALSSRWPIGLALTLAVLIPVSVRAQKNFPSGLKTIAAVRLEGRRRVPAKELWVVLKTRRPSFFPWRERPVVRLDFLSADARAIEQVYRQHGYLDAHAEYRLDSGRDPNAAIVTFTIQAGPQSRVSALEFTGVHAVPEEALRKKLYLRPGQPFNPFAVIVDTARISAVYKERGMLPHVVASVHRESLKVTVRYQVEEGPVYRNGQVYLSSPGESRVKEKLVRRELLLKPGDVYRASRVQRSVERLYETGLFTQVQIAPLPDSTNTRVDFDLRVRERKPRWVDAGVGSGTAERFRFTGEWGHRNLGGQGLQGVIAGRLAFDGNARFLLSRAEASLLEPWLLKSRTRGLVSLYSESRHDRANPKWVVKQQPNGVKFQLRRDDLGRYTRVALTQDNTFVTQDIVVHADTVTVPDSLTRKSYTTHRLLLTLDRDTRDDPINPGRGSLQGLAGEVAGGPLQGTSSFTKGQFATSWYTPFTNGWVFASRLRAGAIDPFGKAPALSPGGELDRQVARVPLEDLFRIGGVNSLRGYKENEIPPSGGLAVLQANAELRIPVMGPFGLEIYLDAGNVWARPAYVKLKDFVPRVSHDRLDPGDMRYTFGAGARVNLPFGPLRIDFTWSPRPDEHGIWRVAEPQFAIGPAF